MAASPAAPCSSGLCLSNSFLAHRSVLGGMSAKYPVQCRDADADLPAFEARFCSFQ